VENVEKYREIPGKMMNMVIKHIKKHFLAADVQIEDQDFMYMVAYR
jgi:hypothetical protein